MTFTQRTVLIATVAIGLAMATTPSDSAAQGFELRTTHKEAPGTREIESGRPKDAIRISGIYLPHVRGLQKVAILTNLCIGHIMTNQLHSAETWCEKAASKPNERAVTHNNRGVLRALQGNFEAAREDFTVAANLSCRLDCGDAEPSDRDLPNHVARRNLQKTEARMVEVASVPASERAAAQGNR